MPPPWTTEMKIEEVYGEQVRTILRGPYCYVEVNLHPSRKKKKVGDRRSDWHVISRECETPSMSGLQVIVAKWKRSCGLDVLAMRTSDVTPPAAPARGGRLRY